MLGSRREERRVQETLATKEEKKLARIRARFVTPNVAVFDDKKFLLGYAMKDVQTETFTFTPLHSTTVAYFQFDSGAAIGSMDLQPLRGAPFYMQPGDILHINLTLS